MEKQKITLLGGGMASLTTAFELTNHDNWQSQYDITLYQLGWRVGGKTSTGRGVHDRIEEVGIHIFQGWYDNAFKIFQQAYDYCYQHNLFPDKFPFKTWQDAFEHEKATLMTQWFAEEGKWISYNLIFPSNDLVPGQGGKKPLSIMLGEMLTLMYDLIFGNAYHENEKPNFWEMLKEDFLELLGRKSEIEQANDAYHAERGHHTFWEDVEGLVGMAINRKAPHSFLSHIIELLKDLDKNPRLHKVIVFLIHEFEKWFEFFCDIFFKKEKRYWIKVMVEFGLVAMRGFFEDIYNPETGQMDFDNINHLDFREWLKEKGMNELTLNSAMVRFLYTGTFANLVGGNGLISAGTAMNFLVESMNYKGSFVWKFKAGTGDTMVAPVYLALQHRGVKFDFFTQVQQVHHDASGEIQKISMGRQVDLAQLDKPYQPLKEVHHIWAWPSEPLYDQLNPQQVEELQKRKINLESAWTDWQNVGDFTLEKGKDFDYVVLGIPIATLGGEKGICNEIINAQPKWKNMYQNIKTTMTQSVQTWVTPDYKALGMNLADWGIEEGGTPNLVTYASPIYSWIDMSEVMSQETWEIGKKPNLLIYFCGSANDPLHTPSFTDTSYPAQTKEQLINIMQQWLQDNMGYFWTNATTVEYPTGFDLSLLFDMYGGQSTSGEEKLRSQYWRVNINPWDRYTLSVPKSGSYRLKTDESGYKNLFLTGDWTNFGVNVGYIEGAVTSGIQAANALRMALNLPTNDGYFKPTVF